MDGVNPEKDSSFINPVDDEMITCTSEENPSIDMVVPDADMRAKFDVSAASVAGTFNV